MVLIKANSLLEMQANSSDFTVDTIKYGNHRHSIDKESLSPVHWRQLQMFVVFS